MADDEQEVQILDNGDVAMDDEDHDAHEMTEMNGEDDVPGKEGVDPETGLSNEGYEGDEETGLILNDSGNKHTVTDSGVEIDGTDSEPNGDQGARSIDGMVDEEDGLLESTEETEFKDDELMMAEQDEPADPGGSINDTETATEYENQGTGTITSYENEGELDTPEYTPPSSPDPEENHTAINMENGTTNDNKFSIKRKFIQHEGADDETTRIESRATFKRKTDWKCICLSLLCFIVMVLAAAFAFFIAMFLLGSLDSIFGKDNSEATAGPPMLPEGPTIEAPPIDRITTLAQIRMDRDWNVIYDFPSSPERTMLENNVISALDNTFRWGNTKFVYEKTEIEEFRQGGNGDSIFVRFRSYFYDVPGGVLSVPEGSSTTPSLDDLYELAREQMAQIVFQTLAAAIDTERLETIGALQGTLELLLSEVTRGS